MSNILRRSLHRLVPSHFRDPFGLGLRLIRTGDPAAAFAMKSTLLGVAAAPLDIVLQFAERRRCATAPDPGRPIILVCGPPRSGTTLLAMVLIRNLPVAYFNNLTAVFPRSPLTANRLFGRRLARPRNDYHSFYGKSAGLGGPNDALYLWDRWLGGRDQLEPAITAAAGLAMRRFFGAMERETGLPLVAKNNSLNASAATVGAVLPTARFLCLRRDPVFLAQSLLRARRDIQGSDDVPYGVADSADRGTDPVDDVCRQVMLHERLAARQLQLLGPERFMVVGYEQFCADPARTAAEVSESYLGERYRPEWRDPALAPFAVANRPRIAPADLDRITTLLAPLRATSQ